MTCRAYFRSTKYMPLDMLPGHACYRFRALARARQADLLFDARLFRLMRHFGCQHQAH